MTRPPRGTTALDTSETIPQATKDRFYANKERTAANKVLRLVERREREAATLAATDNAIDELMQEILERAGYKVAVGESGRRDVVNKTDLGHLADWTDANVHYRQAQLIQRQENARQEAAFDALIEGNGAAE